MTNAGEKKARDSLIHLDAYISHQDASPMRRDASMGHQDASPMCRDASMSHQDASPMCRDASVMPQEASPTPAVGSAGIQCNNTTHQEVNRLTDVRHTTRIDRIATALQALGKHLDLRVV